MSDVWSKFARSVFGPIEKREIEIERVECSVCGAFYVGDQCPNCGHSEDSETTTMQEFVKSLRGAKLT